MGRPRKIKVERGARLRDQTNVFTILNALLDSTEVYVSSADIHVVGHKGESYMNYILLKMGELDQEQYAALCKLVNGLGGRVNILSQEKHGDQGNIRIWTSNPS